MGTKGRPLRTTRQVSNLQARPGWYRIRAQAGGPAQVSIYDEIGMLGVSADALLRDLAGIDGDIELHLNSPGGDVFDGIAIYNTLKQRPGVVAVVVDGLAASAASFIAQAASPGHLAMAPHSQMMIHDGFGMAIGNAADMRQMAGLLDKASDNISRIYADRSGKPADYWRGKMREETWLDDHEAVAEGLADSIVGQDPPVRNAWDLSVYLNAPGARNASGREMHGDHEAMDPDGDGDYDCCADGDTDHDYVMPDGSPGPKAAPSNRLDDGQVCPRCSACDYYNEPGSRFCAMCAASVLNVSKPHGDVPYADPGYLDADGEQVSKSGKEGVARYPVDAEHVQAAWSYINQEDNASQYTAEQLASIKKKIKSAMAEHGHEVSGDGPGNASEVGIWNHLVTALEGSAE